MTVAHHYSFVLTIYALLLKYMNYVVFTAKLWIYDILRLNESIT